MSLWKVFFLFFLMNCDPLGYNHLPCFLGRGPPGGWGSRDSSQRPGEKWPPATGCLDLQWTTKGVDFGMFQVSWDPKASKKKTCIDVPSMNNPGCVANSVFGTVEGANNNKHTVAVRSWETVQNWHWFNDIFFCTIRGCIFQHNHEITHVLNLYLHIYTKDVAFEEFEMDFWSMMVSILVA